MLEIYSLIKGIRLRIELPYRFLQINKLQYVDYPAFSGGRLVRGLVLQKKQDIQRGSLTVI